jgi:hypothetical protein
MSAAAGQPTNPVRRAAGVAARDRIPNAPVPTGFVGLSHVQVVQTSIVAVGRKIHLAPPVTQLAVVSPRDRPRFLPLDQIAGFCEIPAPELGASYGDRHRAMARRLPAVSD